MMAKSNYDLVYSKLKKCEPQTPNEIAEQANINQKTAQTILFELAATDDKVQMKKIGRYRLFWKEK